MGATNYQRTGTDNYGTDNSSGGYVDDINLSAQSNPDLSGDISQRVTPIVNNRSGIGTAGLIAIAIVVFIGYLIIKPKAKA